MTTITTATRRDSAELRNRTSRQCLGGGEWGPPENYTDLRGTPVGDTFLEWEWDRLALPRPRAKRRTRQRITVRYCAEGWHADSGGPSSPMGLALCATLLDPRWSNPYGGLDRDKFHAFHDKNPVVWRVRARTGSRAIASWYCDAELPDEYLPEDIGCNPTF